ncbi:GNAT family N-acetyltransferase [Alkalilacustris brevis]|uniref:GNAT family N-acetyltransferase n=1 Tax=Alkalilacustris brevis TaxID=2026338 RepID=UPI000E0DE69C|nr:GNAT family N-acetyltransferase [Alkalilacustris brevis]
MAQGESITIRAARRDDAGLLADAINMAGHGLPAHFWQAEAGPDGDALAIGRARAARDEGGFSWRNGLVAELAGQPVGALISYRIGRTAQAVPPDAGPLVRALIELENLAPETCYVNAVAVLAQARGKGVARTLMTAAEAARGPAGMSLITTDDNLAAQRLYHSLGYAERARRPLHSDGWQTASREWVLMTKP